MTANQINYAKHKEEKRANQAKEAIEWEANRQKRLANELQAQRQQEEIRHNMVSENISSQQAVAQAESARGAYLRGQAAMQGAIETNRHNIYDEEHYGLKYGTDATKTANWITGGTGAAGGAKVLGDAMYNIYNRIKEKASEWTHGGPSGTYQPTM